ncbi:hypothetical protein J3325_04260 [Leuconostoc mesenteroides]|jgi:hypothetical protein|nr:hypothetical protein [Leuconostoc mesenteroides]MBZ1526999.1 hypothetical protein [Leuconostoc mesenteroides]
MPLMTPGPTGNSDATLSLAANILSSVYEHNAQLYTHLGRTELSQSEPITIEQAAKDFQTLVETVRSSKYGN